MKPGHEERRHPSVHVHHAVAAWLGDTEGPVKEGLLWREQGPRSPHQQDRNVRCKERGGVSDRALSSPHPGESARAPWLSVPDPQPHTTLHLSTLPPAPAAGCRPLLPPGWLLRPCFRPVPQPHLHPTSPATHLRSQTGQVKTRVPRSTTGPSPPCPHSPPSPHLSATPTACRRARCHLDLDAQAGHLLRNGFLHLGLLPSFSHPRGS